MPQTNGIQDVTILGSILLVWLGVLVYLRYEKFIKATYLDFINALPEWYSRCDHPATDFFSLICNLVYLCFVNNSYKIRPYIISLPYPNGIQDVTSRGQILSF